jgi:hypothetical protein
MSTKVSKTAAIRATQNAITVHGAGTSWTLYGPYYSDKLDGPSTSQSATSYDAARRAAAQWRARLTLQAMGLLDTQEADEAAEYAMYDAHPEDKTFRRLLEIGIEAARRAAMPAEAIVIKDGQFMWPAWRSRVARAGLTEEDVRALDPDGYSQWAGQVGMAAPVAVGSKECIDLCQELIGGGATVWEVA